MNTAIFIILTTSHNDLNEPISIVKGGQHKFSIDIVTYDMSYLKENTINEDNLNKIKSIVDFHYQLDTNAKIHIIGDENQWVSVMNKLVGKYKVPPLFVQIGNSVPLV